MGIYRGVKEHQARKRHLKAQKEEPKIKVKKEMDQVSASPAAAMPVDTYARPSTVSQTPEMPGDGFVGGNLATLPPPSADETSHYPASPDSSLLSPTHSELSSSSSGSFREVGTVSEIDSTPIEPPPEYYEKC
ncbi:hypothetical protein H2204_004291 [Knufia peltigerae]|uniref:Uncharacterized protein n=1 Tax=Knufia peltigerae TaxID=1002370 RepID=A0AA39D124_9EURO|nr:hypothetical protein H2204_004291 [Knufia peltigerae]